MPDAREEMCTEDPFYLGIPVKNIPLKDMTEFRIMEDLDGVHIQSWGESVKPQSHCKLVYTHTQLIQFANSEEYHFGYSQFVVPEEFAEDLEAKKIHYITLIKDGKETSTKYRITKVD
jgi:hypothetical protein